MLCGRWQQRYVLSLSVFQHFVNGAVIQFAQYLLRQAFQYFYCPDLLPMPTMLQRRHTAEIKVRVRKSVDV